MLSAGLSSAKPSATSSEFVMLGFAFGSAPAYNSLRDDYPWWTLEEG
jgi:hypothetical protein